ncbi:hypothetical protein LOC68_01160 [Blastopirellula sp. JC732]|uniref:Uncharacterized protein n=1 Tax=Blastopirellula sediminis TaxID=2894196 RepID=A0A9X1MH51_9BACT|nr:hypothetical protein [Blastopirellula sediminis]MCC9608204.1 hypothetical protein [Blastopirellula sediminis]MCC9627003.1 hypothetical protein [Blastopirellula sediminis]
MSQSIQKQLDAHGTKPRDLDISLPGGKLRLKDASVEAVGVSASGAHYAPNKNWDVGGDAGQRLAGKLKSRVNYLLEPLEVIETEEDSILLRSDKPHQSEEDRSYYEGWAKPDGFDLHRYAAAPKQPRQSTPLRMTRDVVERLARDLDGLSGE